MRFLSLLLAAAALLAAFPAEAAPAKAQAVREALSAMLPALQIEGREYSPRTIEEVLRHHKVPGVGIAVIDGGELVWSGGYGLADAGEGRPVTGETLFQAASISKPVAALTALALVEQGRLALDAPVNDRLRSWKLPDGAFPASGVTLAGLLGHRAGLTVSGFPGYAAGAPLPTLPQILDGAAPANTAPVRIELRPGSEWRYSGGGYALAQLLMSDAAGEPFERLAERLVLEPLGMRASSFAQPLPAPLAARAAAGHDAKAGPIPGDAHLYPEQAAAGLWTTPADIARFAIGLSDAFAGRAGGPVSAEAARRMLTAGPGDWGLGLNVQGEGEALRFTHGGVNEGFRAMMTMSPREGRGLVVMTNGDNGAAIIPQVALAVARALGWPEPKPRMIKPAAIARAVLIERVGRYGTGSGSIWVALSGDGLRLAVPGEGSFELVPIGEDGFVAPDLGVRLQFRSGADGAVTGLGFRGEMRDRTL